MVSWICARIWVEAARDVLFCAETLDDCGVLFLDKHPLRPAEHVERDILKLDTEVFADHLATSEDPRCPRAAESNATQTDRAIAILHALTGSIDAAGGNLHLAQVPVNDVSGNELREVAQWQKALGLAERPLGIGKSGWILSDDLYRAAIDAQPYRVRGLVGFGLNLLLSHADSARGAEALSRLEFHVQTDLYLTPTAAFADIVLPVASAWEREGLRVGFGLDQDACGLVQFRPAVVAPRGEARADIDIVFDLAVRLGLGNQFWQGDVEAALDHHLAPSGISMATLRANPRGIRVPLAARRKRSRSSRRGW